MYLSEPRPEISQGDIFDRAPLVSVAQDADSFALSVALRESRAILLTHDCEYDKPSNPWIVVAEVRPLAEIAADAQGHIRQYRTRNTFYLEGLPDGLPESYVDFRRLTRLPKTALTVSPETTLRLASLDEEARTALQRQIAIFFGYGR